MVTTFSVAMVAALLPQSDPMIELKAVYPYADPLCAAVSANGTLGFVAEGAGISVVKLDGTCANVPRTPLDGSIWAIEPYGEQLFIAGGTMGLFELPICTSDLLNCEACDGWGIGSPAPLADPPGDKVCIDVAVDGPNDKLYALFSAEDATDLYTYDLAAISQGPVISGQPSTIDGRGYAIAVDPTDADHVYVAMGEGGFARVTLSTQAWDQGPILDEEPWQMTSCDGGQVVHPASVRDLSIAVVDSGAGQKRFLYAAADRSGLVEIDLDVTWRQIMDL